MFSRCFDRQVFEMYFSTWERVNNRCNSSPELSHPNRKTKRILNGMLFQNASECCLKEAHFGCKGKTKQKYNH
ncbi:unnamed protein product [Larinioides sclopetarius]|uniref:Uncharacterized protein n=1 Tax=Larinioides sclopetarius TaxID=280406 RepID=A0AAV1ZJC1_9ARAC